MTARRMGNGSSRQRMIGVAGALVLLGGAAPPTPSVSGQSQIANGEIWWRSPAATIATPWEWNQGAREGPPWSGGSPAVRSVARAVGHLLSP